MGKAVLPIYNICNLSDLSMQNQLLMADRFSNYLAAHTHLVFPHKHSFYHLVFFTKGAGSHSIDFVNFSVASGQIYFMTPGQVHSWDFEGNVDGYIINFSENYLSSLLIHPRYIEQFSFFSGTAQDQVIPVLPNDQGKLAQFFEEILQENASDKVFKDDLIKILMLQVFILLERYSNDEKTLIKRNGNSLVLHQFKKLVDLHYKDKRLPKEYADLLYVTPNHLNALSKDLGGKPAGEIIRDRVLLEAKRLLVNASLTIAEIVADLHFDDNSYFSRFFKKYEGVGPEDFRRQFNNKK